MKSQVNQIMMIAIIFLCPTIILGQVTFVDMAQEWGVLDQGHSRGVCATDIDNDGTSEIFIVNKYGVNRLYKWDGQMYQDVGVDYNIFYTVEHHSITIVDFDKDRYPDFYVISHPFLPDARYFRNEGFAPFEEVAVELNLDEVDDMGASFFQLTPTSDMASICGDMVKIKSGDEFVDITDICEIGFVPDVSGPQHCDIDGDFDDDLLFGSYWSQPGRLFRNNGDSTFTDITTNTNEGGFPPTTGASFGDIDGDEDFDIYVVNSNYNTMWVNDGTGFFTNMTYHSNTGVGGYSRGTCFGDFDNDGDIDLFINRALEPNMLFINDGTGVFTDISYEAGVMDNLNGFACAVSDFNNDGQLDIVSVNCDYEPVQLYINQNQNTSYLKVQVIGQSPNTLGIGAVVKLYGIIDDPAPDTIYIGMREVFSLSSMLAVDDIVQHFGTGEYQNLMVEATFPSRARTYAYNITPGQTITITESMTDVNDNYAGLPSSYLLLDAYPNPFNSSTQISITGDISECVIAIYDILGREVKTAAVKDIAGKTSFIWDGTNNSGDPVPSGIYVAKAISGDYAATTKITLLK